MKYVRKHARDVTPGDCIIVNNCLRLIVDVCHDEHICRMHMLVDGTYIEERYYNWVILLILKFPEAQQEGVR